MPDEVEILIEVGPYHCWVRPRICQVPLPRAQLKPRKRNGETFQWYARQKWSHPMPMEPIEFAFVTYGDVAKGSSVRVLTSSVSVSLPEVSVSLLLEVIRARQAVDDPAQLPSLRNLVDQSFV